MKRQHKLELTDEEVETLSIALKVYVDSFENLEFHSNSQIGQTHKLIGRVKAIRHGDKSQGAYALLTPTKPKQEDEAINETGPNCNGYNT